MNLEFDKSFGPKYVINAWLWAYRVIHATDYLFSNNLLNRTLKLYETLTSDLFIWDLLEYGQRDQPHAAYFQYLWYCLQTLSITSKASWTYRT